MFLAALNRNLAVDREFYRFYFRDRTTNIDEKQIQLVEGREYCEEVHLVKVSIINNFI